jgi:hypothetical protein
MERLNLTLDVDTANAIDRHARLRGVARASVARELIREALAQRDSRERQQRLARDYAAGGDDATAVLAEMESAQSDLLDEV